MKTPYDYLESYYKDRPELFAFLENSPRTDYIVTLMIDGSIANELLQYSGEDDTWVWSNDWWEGENGVTWVAIVALEDVETYVPDPGDTAYKWRTD